MKYLRLSLILFISLIIGGCSNQDDQKSRGQALASNQKSYQKMGKTLHAMTPKGRGGALFVDANYLYSRGGLYGNWKRKQPI